MSTTIHDTLSLDAKKPLDIRAVVNTRADLAGIQNPYAGMIVFISDLATPVLVRSLKTVGLKQQIDPNTVLLLLTQSTSITWSKVNHPDTVKGYNITDAYISGNYIKLGSNSITISTLFSGNYSSLSNKPKLNGIEISNSRSAHFYGIALLTDIPYVKLEEGVLTVGSSSIKPRTLSDTYIDNGNIVIGSDSILVNKHWTGTLLLYNNLPLIDLNTIYMILLSSSVTWYDISNKPKDIFGYGILDAYIDGGTIRLGDNNLVVQRHWSGTKDEYESLPVKLSDVLYLIYGSNSKTVLPTTNYNQLINKPRINSILLLGNKTSSDLGLSVIKDSNSNLVSTVKVGYTMKINEGILDFVDAPNDGRAYVRCNGQWLDVTDRLKSYNSIKIKINGTDLGRWYINSLSTSYVSLQVVYKGAGTYTISFKLVLGYKKPDTRSVSFRQLFGGLTYSDSVLYKTNSGVIYYGLADAKDNPDPQQATKIDIDMYLTDAQIAQRIQQGVMKSLPLTEAMLNNFTISNDHPEVLDKGKLPSITILVPEGHKAMFYNPATKLHLDLYSADYQEYTVLGTKERTVDGQTYKLYTKVCTTASDEQYKVFGV